MRFGQFLVKLYIVTIYHNTAGLLVLNVPNKVNKIKVNVNIFDLNFPLPLQIFGIFSNEHW